jgi:hypothetical protein
MTFASADQGGLTMSRRSIVAACLLTLTACASPAPERPVGVLVVEDPERVRNCRPLGTVSDDDLGDLQRKAARLGADTALLTPQRKSKGGYFGLQDYMTADAYRCEGSR